MSKKQTFEEAFKRLEEIAALLDSGETPLEESMKLYEEGMKLIKICSEKLEQAEQKIRKLSEKADGSFEETDFEPLPE